MEKETLGSRLHIGIFGSVNAGKSTLFNLLTDQDISIVSEIEGTTTDSVSKAMEIRNLGPVVFIDTAGFDDNSQLGNARQDKTLEAVKKCDILLVVLKSDSEKNSLWYKNLEKTKKNLIDIFKDELSDKNCRENILEKIRRNVPENFNNPDIVGNLVSSGDNVVLVMPQDIQAPKGRLILPQVQVIRELLDKKCLVHCATQDNFVSILSSLKEPPKLIITDSQVFKFVFDNKREQSKLTSFSILLAKNKGDIQQFVESAQVIKTLSNNSKVLVAEACTHVPTDEDIGRVKIPNLLKKLYPNITIDFVRGVDFPKTLVDEEGNKLYDLIIHCGACMFNRTYVLSRQEFTKENNIPMVNYGVFIAFMNDILDKVVY